jgi:hypothetical protein
MKSPDRKVRAFVFGSLKFGTPHHLTPNFGSQERLTMLLETATYREISQMAPAYI